MKTPARPTAKPAFKAQLRYADSIEHLERGHQWVLPATPEAYAAQLQAAAKALAKGVALNDNNPEWEENQLRYLFVAQAKRMLAVIGITAPTKGRK